MIFCHIVLNQSTLMARIVSAGAFFLMNWTLIVGLVGFVFVASITPGPNNLMLMASGANFGLRRSWAHLAGVNLGFALMVLLVGLGFAGLIAMVPWLYVALRWASGAYMVYLAYKIATAKGLGAKNTGAKPMTFFQAAAFQWINPKGWAMSLTAVATYALRDNLAVSVVVIAAVVAVIGAPCVLVWTIFGMGMKRLLTRPAALRAFNLGMATLLLLSLYPLLTERLT